MSRMAKPSSVGAPANRSYRGLGFGHVSVAAPRSSSVSTRTPVARNAPGQQLSLADQIVDGRAHERYGAVEISTLGPLTRQIHLDDRQFAEIVSAAQEHVD